MSDTEIEEINFERLLHEDNKSWQRFFWMKDRAWEKERDFDTFSFNIVKLFTVLNSTAIGGLIAIVANNTELLSEKSEVIYNSFFCWSIGITAAFLCLLLWYMVQTTTLFEAEKVYREIIESESASEKPRTKFQLIGGIVFLFISLFVIACGISTGLFFVIGCWNIALNIL